jgi:hypothetical protein
MSADRRCAFNLKSHNNWSGGLGGKIDVASGYIGTSIILEREQVDLTGNHCLWSHCESAVGAQQLSPVIGGNILKLGSGATRRRDEKEGRRWKVGRI